jgi:hypothetical protein
MKFLGVLCTLAVVLPAVFARPASLVERQDATTDDVPVYNTSNGTLIFTISSRAHT